MLVGFFLSSIVGQTHKIVIYNLYGMNSGVTLMTQRFGGQNFYV